MRSIRALSLLLTTAFAACSTDDGGGVPELCLAEQQAALSCAGSHAAGSLTYPGGSTSQTNGCRMYDRSYTATCAQGCALQIDGIYSQRDGYAIDEVQVLCAEAPTAQVGDTCGNDEPCLPTRARLAADGTVIDQAYLTCDTDARRCVADLPPAVDGYLAACSPAVVARYGTANAVGAVYDASFAGACLIAWDPAAQAAVSGVTVRCDGDWDCPAGALCDDQIVRLDSGSRAGVCKPGPRGTLTPAMLAK